MRRTTTTVSPPAWLRTAQVCAVLGDWEAVLRVYYAEWHGDHVTVSEQAQHAELFDNAAYARWFRTHQGRHHDIKDETHQTYEAARRR